MNKFFCELSSVFMLDNVLRLTDIKESNSNFNPVNFRRTQIGDNTMFVKLSKSSISELEPFITECIPEKNILENYDDCDDDINGCNNDDIEVRLGHVPILFDPCKKFRWTTNSDTNITNFKRHFSNCDQCKYTDNNESSIISKFETAIFQCVNMKKETIVNELIEHYQLVKRWKMEFEGNERNFDHIIIYRIDIPDNLYYGCCIIIW